MAVTNPALLLDAPTVRELSTPILRELPGVFNAQPAASTTTVANLPAGYTYDSISIYMTIAGVAATRAQIAAQLSLVRVLLSGVELASATGAQAMSIGQWYSQVDTSANGLLDLSFFRGWTKDLLDGLGATLGTADQSSLQIECTWAAGATINASTVYSARQPKPADAGVVCRWARVFPTVNALGLYSFSDLPAPRAGEELLAMHLFPPVVANLTRIGYLKDDVRVIDAPPFYLNQMALEAGNPRTPQGASGMVSVDFTALRGTTQDAIPMSITRGHTLEMTFANAAPGSFAVICEIATQALSVGG